MLVPLVASPATVDRRRAGHHEEERIEKVFSGALTELQVNL